MGQRPRWLAASYGTADHDGTRVYIAASGCISLVRTLQIARFDGCYRTQDRSGRSKEQRWNPPELVLLWTKRTKQLD